MEFDDNRPDSDEVNSDLRDLSIAARREEARKRMAEGEQTVKVSAIPGLIRYALESIKEFEALAASEHRLASNLDEGTEAQMAHAKKALRYRKYVAQVRGILK